MRLLNILKKILPSSAPDDKNQNQNKDGIKFSFTAQELDEINEKFRIHSQKNLEIDNEEKNLIRNVNDYILFIGNYYHTLGFYAGQIGAKDSFISNTTYAHALHLQQYVHSTISSKISEISTKLHHCNEATSSLEEILRKLRINKERIEATANDTDESRKYSTPLALLYVFFGFALLIADIPLSLNIVESFEIFNFGENETFFDKIRQPDALTFALGISFCTIFIKLLYDDYISVKAGSWSKLIAEEVDKRKKNFLIYESIGKLTVKIFILVSIIIMFYNIGIVRMDTTPENNELNNTPDQVTSIESNSSGVSRTDQSLFWAFTLISILIPLISGICLSLGFQIIRNILLLKKTIKAEKSAEAKLLASKDDIKGLNNRLDHFNSSLSEWGQKELKINILSHLFTSQYFSGYKKAQQICYGFDIYKEVENKYFDWLNIPNYKNITKIQPNNE